jgi:hypothetical protein
MSSKKERESTAMTKSNNNATDVTKKRGESRIIRICMISRSTTITHDWYWQKNTTDESFFSSTLLTNGDIAS